MSAIMWTASSYGRKPGLKGRGSVCRGPRSALQKAEMPAL